MQLVLDLPKRKKGKVGGSLHKLHKCLPTTLAVHLKLILNVNYNEKLKEIT